MLARHNNIDLPYQNGPLVPLLRRQVVDVEFAVCDEQDRDVIFGSSPVLHLNSGGKPDEVSGSERPGVGNQSAFKDIHAMRACVDVSGVDYTRMVAHDADLGAGFGIFNQVLSEKCLSEMLVPA